MTPHPDPLPVWSRLTGRRGSGPGTPAHAPAGRRWRTSTAGTTLFSWAALLAVAVAAGLGFLGLGQLHRAGRSPQRVFCAGQQMRPGDTCRRDGRIVTYSDLVAERDHALAVSRQWTTIGSTLLHVSVGPALLLLGAGLIRRRRTAATGVAPVRPPTAVQRLAGRHGLGTFERGYRRRSNNPVRAIGPLVVAALALLLVGGLVQQATLVVVATATLAVVPVYATGYILNRIGWALGRCGGDVYRYTGGLVLAHNGRRTAVAWSAVEQIRADEWVDFTGTVFHRSYRLTGPGFTPLRLGDDTLLDLADLAAHAVPAIAAAQLPGALDRLAADAEVTFGPYVTADRRGITVAGHRAPWSIIDDVRPVQMTNLAFPVPGRPVRIHRSDIANLALLQLLARHLGAGTSAPAPQHRPTT